MCSADLLPINSAYETKTVRREQRWEKRRVDTINQIKVQAVCIGIEHLVNAHRKASEERSKNGKRAAAVRCQLCESTRRVLRAAREHSSLVGHDQTSCDACQMWALVRARYTYLQRIQAANARSAALNEAFEAKCSKREGGSDFRFTEDSELPCPSQRKRVRFCSMEVAPPVAG